MLLIMYVGAKELTWLVVRETVNKAQRHSIIFQRTSTLTASVPEKYCYVDTDPYSRYS